MTIIDSHVHLPSPSSSDFTTASSSVPLTGYILIESNLPTADTDWTPALSELKSMASLLTSSSSEPKPLALVPWAPLPLGPAKLEEYLAQAESEAGPEAWSKVRGFRYLLRDKPKGTGLEEGFVEGLKVLGRKRYVFEIGVDAQSKKGGRARLEEVVEMVGRVNEAVGEEGERARFVLEHLCKPDLSIINQADPSFLAWRSAMFTLGKSSNTYLKLSGCFSELPDKLKAESAEDIFSAMLPWLAVVVAAFGPRRLMFGSDWPACTLGVGDDAWSKWRRVVELVCNLAGLSEEDKAMVWGGTAKEVYKLDG